MRSMLLGVVMLLASGLPSLAQQPGAWVLMQYRGGPYWFPGVVTAVGRGVVTVRYDDGEVETRPANQVKPYDWRVGSPVECNWNNSGKWYSGRIAAANGGRLQINYDDGDRETTTTGRCRSR